MKLVSNPWFAAVIFDFVRRSAMALAALIFAARFRRR